MSVVPDDRPRQIFTSAKRRRRASDVPLYGLLLLALMVSAAIALLLLFGA